jgi:hypothetical protein
MATECWFFALGHIRAGNVPAALELNAIGGLLFF